jgi:hypothetical protein
MPERSQDFTSTKDVGRAFILRSTLPTQWAVYPIKRIYYIYIYVYIYSQGIMSCAETCNNPGLHPTKGQVWPCCPDRVPTHWTHSRTPLDEWSSRRRDKCNNYSSSLLIMYISYPQYSNDCSPIEHLSESTKNAPWRWQCNAETCRSYHT